MTNACEEDVKFLLRQLAVMEHAQDRDAISRIAFKYNVECPTAMHDGKKFYNNATRRRVIGNG